MIRRLGIAVAAAGVVAIGSLFLYARLLNERAETMLRTVYELSDHKQIPALADIQQRFGNRLKRLNGCPPSECAYTVVLSNRVLAGPSYPAVHRNGVVLQC